MEFIFVEVALDECETIVGLKLSDIRFNTADEAFRAAELVAQAFVSETFSGDPDVDEYVRIVTVPADHTVEVIDTNGPAMFKFYVRKLPI